MSARTKKVLTLDESHHKVVRVEEKPKYSSLKVFSVGLATEIGYSIAVPIVLGAFLGVWLDSKFNTKPKLTLSFIVVGIILSFLQLFRIVNDIIKKGKR